MQQLKAIVLKEWQTQKNSFLMPFWVLSGIYGIGLISLIYGSIRFGLPTLVTASYNDPNFAEAIWTFHYGAATAIAWLCILTTFGMSDSTLNSDHIKKCEIFHLAQPISLIKILSAKALFAVGGIFVQYLVLATVNCVVLSVISGILGIPSLSLGLNAVLNNIPYVISGLILITPLVWFANSVFRKLGAMKAAIFLAVFEIIRGLFSLSWDISLYSPLGFINRVLFKPFNVASEHVLVSMDFSKVASNMAGWRWDYTWEHLTWLMVNVLLIIASYHIYKRRNIY